MRIQHLLQKSAEVLRTFSPPIGPVDKGMFDEAMPRLCPVFEFLAPFDEAQNVVAVDQQAPNTAARRTRQANQREVSLVNEASNRPPTHAE